ncbi:hypothetical protein Dimus_002040 [Dionaea muscipula]
MMKSTNILRRGVEAIKDLGLLKVLRSEISHELSANRFQNYQHGSLGGFSIESDLPHSQDIFLRKKCQTGEEVAISALLSLESRQESGLPWDLQMKVCIKKPGLGSIMQFDCGVRSRSNSSSEFSILGAYYLPIPSTASLSPSDYRGPSFSTLDPQLQLALKSYLEDKGIEGSLTNFLLLHLHKKEQNQYVEWLKKIETLVEGG